MPDANELVCEWVSHAPTAKVTSDVRPPVSIVTIEYVLCHVRGEAEERVFIILTEYVLCQVRCQNEETVEHRSHNKAQHK